MNIPYLSYYNCVQYNVKIMTIKIFVFFRSLHLVLLLGWFYLFISEKNVSFIALLKGEVTIKFERFNVAV